MIRIIALMFVGAFVGAFLTNGSQVGIWAGFIIPGVLIILPLLQGRTALKCPACRKRIKIGAASCHHCGRTVTEARNA